MHPRTLRKRETAKPDLGGCTCREVGGVHVEKGGVHVIVPKKLTERVLNDQNASLRVETVPRFNT